MKYYRYIFKLKRIRLVLFEVSILSGHQEYTWEKNESKRRGHSDYWTEPHGEPRWRALILGKATEAKVKSAKVVLARRIEKDVTERERKRDQKDEQERRENEWIKPIHTEDP